MTEPLRLSKRMSELGLCSRREADEWIARGWVRVDGQVVSELGSKVLPSPERHRRAPGRGRAVQARHGADQQADRLRQRPGRGWLQAGGGAGQAGEPLGRRSVARAVPPDPAAQPGAGRPARHRFGRPAGADPGRPRRQAADRRGHRDRQGIPGAGAVHQAGQAARRRPEEAEPRPVDGRQAAAAGQGALAERRPAELHAARRQEAPDPPHVRDGRPEGGRPEARAHRHASSWATCRSGQWRYLRPDEQF